MRKHVLYISVAMGVASAMLPIGCGSPESETIAREGILVEVGDSALTVNDILARIPSGLSEEDSTEMFNTLVERWVRTMMLTDVASENVADLEKINRMAEDYRNSLIIERYLRSKQKETPSVSERSVRMYYAAHGEELKLEAPIIKGIFLKVSDSEERLEDIRCWMAAATSSSIDNIEKYGLRQASQYEYFKDNWIDWNEMAERIPYRFYDADAFLGSTKDFETSYGGSTYILHIFDYLPTGSVMPYEYASPRIADMIDREKKNDYRVRLLSSLYAKGIEDGKLKPGLYDPVKRRMKATVPVDNNNKNKTGSKI